MADKVAYLALTSSSFNREELMRCFFNEQNSSEYSLYIHNKLPIESEYFSRFQLPPEYKVETSWGKYSLVLATIRLLSWALKDPDNQRFVLISESHCPIYDIATTNSIVLNNYPILSFSDQPREQSWAKPRFQSFIKNKNSPTFTFDHCRFVSQWFICNRSDAQAFVKNEGKFRKHFNTNNICMPDEIYFHMMASKLQIPFQYKTNCYFNWYLKTSQSLVNSGLKEKPKTYGKIPNKLVECLRQNGDYIFLRKVIAETSIDENFLINHGSKINQ